MPAAPPLSKISYSKERECVTKRKELQTDVLVIGGGIAGCFAAIEARKTGAEVLLADKGYVSSSGQTPYAGTFMVFDPEIHDKQEWLSIIRRAGDYLVNLDWTEVLLDKSKECLEDLISYGVEFSRDENGEVILMGGPGGDKGGCKATAPKVHSLSPALRKAVLKSGVKILDRTMMADLIVSDGRVSGAVGMTVTDAIPVAITAKNVVMATGGSALKPPSWPVSGLTGDGDMMAYRVGAHITGKEFVDTHPTITEDPSYMGRNTLIHDVPTPGEADAPPPPPRTPEQMKGMVNGLGEKFPSAPNLNLGSEFEVHAGRGPIYSPGGMGPMPAGYVVACASSGMACHKTEGIWAAGMDGSSTVPGLYSAGDCHGGMVSGAAYASIGIALADSAVTGKVAGAGASKDLDAIPMPTVATEVVDALVENFYAPMERKTGFKASWLIRLLQNTMMPYYVMSIKHGERLEGVLSQVRFMKNHIVPKLYAENDHELRLAIEAKNMVTNVELKLVSALARKESRGTHYREDYPDRDEENFSAWLTVHQEDGVPVVEKKKMPEAWAWHEGEPRLVTFPTEF